MFDSDFYDKGYQLIRKYEIKFADRQIAQSCLNYLANYSLFTWDHWSTYKHFRKLIKPYATEDEIKEMNHLFWEIAFLKFLWNQLTWFSLGFVGGFGFHVALKIVIYLN